MKHLLPFILSLLFFSCEKNINFTPRDAGEQVVVDASIESGRYPEVRLSRSLSYFSKLTPELLSGAFIHGAEITVSNGTKTHRLREYERTLQGGLKIYYYTADSLRPANAFRGEHGKEYHLSITVNGKKYTASTTIPYMKKTLDSLWWKPAPKSDDPTKAIVMGRFTDPPGYGNYIRYYMQVNDGPFYPPLTSAFDDQIVDGKTYDIQLESGVNRADDIDLEDYGFFYLGETITVKFCNIDKATFDFWRTMEYNYSSIGNPFSSPTKVLGNIQGGALGYFGGFAVQYRSISIQ
ncbi:DUF4249 domain-containing protein [Pseudoflavitalea sp. G-6-1-2]|uniref:DUF4249 domain-containing protein n=1 Tax=Pseudoflavitalea sp. G-6-1-2 TaxID=2728841 RepID=UPI00146EC7BC|nr:DUF4249 domain-containing protein [Pseudoflavitalea sp. G-6-1-2]NML21943.1 DUF4249 domain-containing protein [Pseudoflavitalea sp. G-6-1-2]